jgi:hypothetical protein
MSDNIFSVSDEEWGHYYACQWDRWLEFCGELDKRQRDIYERFYWSADVDRFIRESELAGCKPGLDFDFVIQCNPRRDMNILLNNITSSRC